MKAFQKVLTLGCAALVLATVLLPAQVQAQSTRTPWRNMSPAQLTAVWWQWALSIPVSSSPWFDDTGASALANQPYVTDSGGDGDLLFLAGTFIVTQLQNGDVVGEVTRTITCKKGTALFFPLLNTEYDNILGTPHRGGTTPSTTVMGFPQLLAAAKASMDVTYINSLYAKVTPTDSSFQVTGPAVNLNIVRLSAPPFAYRLPAHDNVIQNAGIDVSGTIAPAAADGFWSAVSGGATGLGPGYYLLEFGGSMPINNGANTFSELITYHLTVTP